MKTAITIVFLMIAGVQLQAQTLRIGHRSHSGGSAAFTTAGEDNFGKIAPHHFENERKKIRAADTVKVIKVKPWKTVKDSLPPAVNPLYTKRTAPVSKKAPAKSK